MVDVASKIKVAHQVTSPFLSDLQCRVSQPILHFEGDILNFQVDVFPEA